MSRIIQYLLEERGASIGVYLRSFKTCRCRAAVLYSAKFTRAAARFCCWSAHFHGTQLAKGAIMEQQDGDLAFFIGLVAGAVVGGVAAALLAPRSGLETREQIVDRGLE